MILSCFLTASGQPDPRISVIPLEDYTYNDGEWTRAVSRQVNNFLRTQYPSTTYEEIAEINSKKVGLIGHSKDHSSYYLKLFPTWGNIDVQGVEGGQHKLINATDIRNMYFSPQWHKMDWTKLVPEFVETYLMEWIGTDEYQEIVNEHKFVLDYKKQWANVPYPVIFSTVDAVVVQSGHVLMVKRGAYPGKGKLAIPGGFINPDEYLLDAAIRELREETRLKVPEAVLRGSLKTQRVFDDPNRSSRGRTITNAFLFNLSPQLELPSIKGGDDAASAHWIPISEIKAEDCFEDHYHLLHNLISTL